MIHESMHSCDSGKQSFGTTGCSQAQCRRSSVGFSKWSLASCLKAVVNSDSEIIAKGRSGYKAAFPAFSISCLDAAIRPDHSADANMQSPGRSHAAFPRLAAFFSWISTRHRRADSLFDVKTSLAEALELLPVAIFAVDHNDRIAFANSCLAGILDYTREKLIGARVDSFFPSDCDVDNSFPALNEDHCRHRFGASTTRLLAVQRRNGGSFAAQANTVECRMHNQPFRITALHDRTAYCEVKRSGKELAHLVRVSSLGELTGSLAHELNQPLTAILSNAQAAKRFAQSDTIDRMELNEALNDIVLANVRASEVIQKIRTLARKGDIDLLPLDIGSVVDDIALLVHNDAVIRDVRIAFDVGADLPKVYGDRVQLEQVLLNLILNGLDATKDCSPRDRRVDTTVRADPCGGVRITVRDRGHGLALDQIDTLFMPFFTTKPQGLGLGLSISRMIVNAHGGRLWGENNKGKGASFHVTLPQRQAREEDAARRAS
ncbi:PAS domain-containing sensor histidine kinase [Paraburkholderia strydomiana]